MTKDYSLKNFIPLVIATLLLIYFIISSIFNEFNIYIFTLFFIFIILNIGLFYILITKRNKEQIEPKFYRYFILIAYCFIFIPNIVLFILNIMYVKPELRNVDHYDYVIVFGSSVSMEEEKNTNINLRLDYAINYARKHMGTKFVLTGAKVHSDFMEEALYMRSYMLKNNIFNERILVDSISQNTYENIQNSLYIIKEDMIRRNQYENLIKQPFMLVKDKFSFDSVKIGFLSNDFHLLRINMMAKNEGIKNPLDINVKSNKFFMFYYVMRENLALFKAFALGQLKLF